MSDPEPTERETRLGELVDVFQTRRSQSAAVGLGSLREEAGELFGDLAKMVGCLDVLRTGFGETGTDVPAAVGGYDIHAVLGSGVSGVVYRARRRGTERDVALKVMRESLALSEEAMGRFRREIDIAARLDHEHIVGVLDHGEAGGRLFMAMELVEGISLSDLLIQLRQRGKAPCEAWLEVLDAWGVPGSPGASPADAYARRMAALFAPVADALRHAHECGLIHRDLKPGNLMLGRDGRLHITDFGLAKVLGEEMTTTVAVLGTPAFMSPEQASGASRAVDARSDIYGLGATLYRMLTLEYPIKADSFSEVLAAILATRPEPLSRFCADYPPGLERIVSRCLEKDPVDRYPDAGSLAADLGRCAKGKPPRIGRVPARRRARRFLRRHRWEVGVTAAVMLVGLLVAAWSMISPVELAVRVYPGGAVAIDGAKVGEGSGSWQVARGLHTVRVTLPNFVPGEESVDLDGDMTLAIHLAPVTPFGELSVLAQTYGGSADLPAVARHRGRSEEPVADRLRIHDPDAFEQRLAEFPEKVRERPYIRLFAIQRLLADELYPEAYAAAMELADRYPGESAPLELALAALDRLKLGDNKLYAQLFVRYTQAHK